MLPTWDNSQEYKGLHSDDLTQDMHLLEGLLKLGEKPLHKLRQQDPTKVSEEELDAAWELCGLHRRLRIVQQNLYTYIDSEIALNSKNRDALHLMSRLRESMSKHSSQRSTLLSFVLRLPDTTFEVFLKHDLVQESEFIYRQERQNAHLLLSAAEEELLSELERSGYQSYSELYQNLTGALKVNLDLADESRTIGFAQALQSLEGSDAKLREAAFHGIQTIFREHQESCAAILNARASWNIQVMKRRHRGHEFDYLQQSLHQNRMQRATLDAMMGCLEHNRDVGQSAIRTFAQASGKELMNPWDLKAPAPARYPSQAGDLDFFTAMKMVEESYAAVNPELGKFVPMMLEKAYIDVRPRPNRRASAYCTGFSKSRTPRVFLNYSNSIMGARVIAHELGHAFHNWVMRDLPLAQCSYPMTLAETASIFGEIIFSHVTRQKDPDPANEFPTLWMEAEMIVVYLTNIPMRFDFESRMMEKKLKGEVLMPEDLCVLMDDCYRDWHGDTTTQTDPYFWAHKLHFHHYPFYNFPYSFGYLFGYAVYAKWLEMGEDFFPRYCALLRDTGRQTVENLIQTHLDEDCTKTAFWQKGIDVVRAKVERLQALIQS